ncbi:hypothetical protein CDAR_317781 [Caerostris darwini]|uniref:MADF domain-containing protein n=1 Tax=Caerostris darwini TaxID=1538125 RepID=A0AAV4WSK4_9ARAC|nr:hypothetical protein CDAR_317781 [Caerostris darwini]
MSMSICFDEVLISEVQKYPHLYDLSDANHKNRLMRENAWQQIGFAMERNADSCKERFKYLRDKYRKEKNLMNLPSGSHSRYKKPWALYSAMSFLEPYLQTKSSWSNLLSQDEKDVQDSCERSLVETDVENESSFIDQAPPPRKKRKSELFDRALEKVCEINEMDRIGYFMEFAAATVRKFSYEKQNKALDAFYNILSEMNKEM